jgi:predicted permease
MPGESLWRDTRYALRALARTPAFSGVLILSLALAIGANTAIFTLINAVMLRPLPVRDPGQLVELLHRYPGEPRLNGFSWESYRHFQENNHVFSGLIGFAPASFSARVAGAEPEMLHGEYVTGDYFPVLGIDAALGRLIGPADASPVAVASWSLWDRVFHRDAAILGRSIAVGNLSVTVIGVAPRGFAGFETWNPPDLWLPTAIKERGGVILAGRMKPGVSLGQARAEMAVLFRFTLDELTSRSRDSQLRRMTFELEPAGAGLSLLRDAFAKPLMALISIAGLLLSIACANIAGLFLARGAARHYEIAVRVSLGAGRLRLMRHIFLEALLLSMAGSVGGLALAYIGAGTLVRVINSGRLPPGFPPRLDLHTAPDAHVALFTGAIALLTAMLFGLAPASGLRLSAPAFRLQDTARARRRFGRFFGNALVACQIALSMALVSAAALFVHYLSGLERSDLGFQPSRVLLVTLDPARAGYKPGQLAEPYRQLLRRVESVPGVRSVTLSAITPISGAGAARFVSLEGQPERAEDRRYVSLNSIAPRYFETLGTPLIAGRDFRFEDKGRPGVAIVNRAFSRHYFGEQNPIGRRISLDPDPQPYEIVALAGDAKYSDVHEAPPPTVYLNAFQQGRIPSNFSIRTAIAPEALAPEIHRAIRDALPAIPVARVTTLPDQIDASIVPERMVTSLAGAFGILGALLAGLGLYGLVAYSVRRRVKEIGVRMALGATQRAVAGMVVRDALRIVCFGLLMGAPLAVASGRLAGVLISGPPPDSPLPMVVGVAVLIAIALLAAFAPARRAARIDPMEALRHE